MTKLFKNSKSVLSVVLAFAVLAVSLFTGVVINTQAANCDTDGELNVVYVGSGEGGSNAADGSFMTGENAPAGTEEDPYIISTPEHLRYLAQCSTYETTHDKYFEIDDDIDVLCMQREANVESNGGFDKLLNLADAAAVKTYFESFTDVNNWQSGSTSGEQFAGTLDGNGVVILGMYTLCQGLFNEVYEGTTIKNIEIANAYVKSGGRAAALVGYGNASAKYKAVEGGLNNTNCYGYVTFDSCVIRNSYIATTTTTTTNAAVMMAGGATFVNIEMNDCLVYGNTAVDANNANGGLFGWPSTGHDGGDVYPNTIFTDSIILGCVPYTASQTNQGFKAKNYTNIYTDCTSEYTPCGPNGAPNGWADYNGRIITVSVTDVKGANVVTKTDLDWSSWMADDEGYPEPRALHDNITTVSNNNGTHSETCACGFGGVAVDCTYVNGVCSVCGFEVNCATRKTIYWDGTVASSIATGTGTKDDPYIIKTTAELAYIIGCKEDVTAGKYYKIDDSIGAIVLQSEDKAADIMALADAAAVKAYFEDTSKSFLSWKNYGWEGSAFCGNFDGNGVTVYGLYQVSGNNAGLFSTIDAGVAIQNIAVKNSYLTSTASNYQVGAIAAVASVANYGVKNNGLIWFNNIVVANNYMYNASTEKERSGVIFGAASADVTTMDNCLVYGNDATYGDGVTMPLVSATGNGINNATAVKPEGVEVSLYKETDEKYLINAAVRNSVILGNDPYNIKCDASWRRNDPNCFENVLTDAASGEVTFGNGNKWTYQDTQIKTITVADLATAELGDAWINTDSYPELKSFHDEVFSVNVTAAGAAGHSASCSCGLAGSDLQPHSFKSDVDPAEWDSMVCEVCGYGCEHVSMEEGYVEYEGDCVTAAGYEFDCSLCGYHEEDFEEIAGHNFTSHDAKAGADCQTAGTIAYKSCSECGNNYAVDAADTEPFENALTDITGDMGVCIPNEDDSGIVYGADASNHWTTCSVCNEIIETSAHTGTTTPNGATGHMVVCDVCGYESDNAEHTFGDDSICDTCEWECTEHSYKDGETIDLGMAATAEACKEVEQICEICEHKGDPKVIGHTAGDWEVPVMDRNFISACTSDGQHTEVKICQECYFTVDQKIVTDPKAGHAFVEYEEVPATCVTPGTIAYKQCEACWGCFALDAADDEAMENALDQWSGEMDIPVDEENPAHVWVEYESTATCEEDGVAAHKFCTECMLLVVNDEETDVVIDWDAFWKYDEETYEPIGIGAKLNESYYAIQNEAFAAFVAEYYPDEEIEVPALPEDTNDWEAMGAYNEEFYGIWDYLATVDEGWYTAWGEYFLQAYSDELWTNAYHEALLAAAETAEVDMVAEATGHTLTKVDEVPATYEKEGTNAHYACENCGTLYADAEGTTVVTEEELVIAKLVKEEEDKPSTDDKTNDTTDNKTEGDKSDKSPVTGESVASVAAVAALMGAAFVLVRKARKA